MQRAHKHASIGSKQMDAKDRAIRSGVRAELLTIVDQHVSPTAILHLQNGFILPSESGDASADIFQLKFHQDFPRVLNGYVMSINAFFAIDEFTAANGATWVVPGSHQRSERPDEGELRRSAQCVAMWKRRVNETLQSAALRADIAETMACGYLAIIVLAGVVVNRIVHVWWIEYVATALLLAWLIHETKEAFEHAHEA